LEPIPDRHALWKKSDEEIKSTRTDAVLESQPDQAEREESVEIYTIDETGDSLSSLRWEWNLDYLPIEDWESETDIGDEATSENDEGDNSRGEDDIDRPLVQYFHHNLLE
ncbi:hypothetical protein K3495_g15910, partial [Podosphaera aphanis]